MSSYGAVILNLLEKSPAKISTLVNRFFFFLILNFPSVIQSVATDRICPSVVTDEIIDGKSFVGKFDSKLLT